MDFPEYSSQYTKQAREAKKAFPANLRSVLDDIEAELTDNPNKRPERITPAGLDGKVLIYNHPAPQIQVTFQVAEEKKILYFFHFVALSLKVPQKLFISYSHQDSGDLEGLKKFLNDLEQQGVIKFWDDTQIPPGGLWKEEIERALESAVGAVLLVSQNFFLSEFITKTELPKLLDAAEVNGKKIYWIYLRPTDLAQHTEITKYQALIPDISKSLMELEKVQQERVMMELTKRLRKEISVH